MKPEAVLDHEQKRAHFCKYYSKQERLSKLRKRKVKQVRKPSKSVASSPKQLQLPQHRIVKIEQRTPERREFNDEDDFLNHILSNGGQEEPNPVGFQACGNDVILSSFECPSFQQPQVLHTQSLGQMNCQAVDPRQSRVQLPDLDDIHTETLFFWNSMDFLN